MDILEHDFKNSKIKMTSNKNWLARYSQRRLSVYTATSMHHTALMNTKRKWDDCHIFAYCRISKAKGQHESDNEVKVAMLGTCARVVLCNSLQHK